jgi:hypothetical protein
MKKLLLLSFGLAALSAPTLTPAQERVLTVFGNDKCPSNTICVTAPESDRFRIPKELRPASTNPQNQSWASRSQAVINVGSTSPTACNSAGNTGWSGCWAESMRKAKEERKQASRDGQTDTGGLRRVIVGDD